MTFPRLPNGQRAYSDIHRADGVHYRIHQGIAAATVPHDLIHLTVERATHDHGGFWGAVAAGAVFTGMEHIAGRRPPHAAARSATAIRDRAETLHRAELMADLVEKVAHQHITSTAKIRELAKEVLATVQDGRVDEPSVIAAADALRSTADHWATLAPGQQLTIDWPEQHHRR